MWGPQPVGRGWWWFGKNESPQLVGGIGNDEFFSWSSCHFVLGRRSLEGKELVINHLSFCKDWSSCSDVSDTMLRCWDLVWSLTWRAFQSRVGIRKGKSNTHMPLEETHCQLQGSYMLTCPRSDNRARFEPGSPPLGILTFHQFLISKLWLNGMLMDLFELNSPLPRDRSGMLF